MKSKKVGLLLSLLILAGLSLAACSGTPAVKPAAAAPDSVQRPGSTNPAAVQPTQAMDQVAPPEAGSTGRWPEEQSQVDEQGAVAVEILPLNLNEPGGTIDFEVYLNTHSVDLSMNLAELAALSTDTGKTVQATSWDSPPGGHHVSGQLSFPASVDGSPFLDGANRLTLTLVNIDAPERVFVWEK